MPRVDHIRVGFVDSESRYWPVDTNWGKGAEKLANYLWRANVNGRLDLVLGIVPNGASYLLLPQAWAAAWGERVGERRAFFGRSSRKTEYASLSPISFFDYEDLLKKLKAYEQNSVKKKKLGIADTSRANRHYYMTSGQDESNLGKMRAEYEHSRLFFALLQSTESNLQQLPGFFRKPNADMVRLRAEAYAVHSHSALARARILALSFSTITAGTVDDSRVLDIGWCDVSVSSFGTQNAVNYSLHEQKIKVPAQRFRHDHVASEILPSAAICGKLQQILESARPERPIILLVHGAKNTRQELEGLGLRTFSWATGIHDILYKGGLRDEMRSRSPPRRGSGRPRSPPRPSSAVYLIDVNELVGCAKERGTSVTSRNHARVRQILEDAALCNLDVRGRETETRADPMNPKSPMVKKNLFNAGHDSILIAETWLALCSGPDIDAFRAMLGEDARRGPMAEDSPSPEPNPQPEQDDDIDPNIQPPAGSPQAPAMGPAEAYDAYLSDEEGEW
ncbi:unnamed protein product [Peniophora sp. CBMAI 1063]|nr:unnamed protein product [Peniophora sp. CBMAI 1063]